MDGPYLAYTFHEPLGVVGQVRACVRACAREGGRAHSAPATHPVFPTPAHPNAAAHLETDWNTPQCMQAKDPSPNLLRAMV